ncbi:hypothetical protein ACHAQA_009392 [Verticillium albo-atrum]
MAKPIRFQPKDWEDWAPIIKEIATNYNFPAATQDAVEDLIAGNPEEVIEFKLAEAYISVEFVLIFWPDEVSFHCIWIKSIRVTTGTEHKVATITSVLHTSGGNSNCPVWSAIDQQGFSIPCCSDWVASYHGLDYISKYELNNLPPSGPGNEAGKFIDLTLDDDNGTDVTETDFSGTAIVGEPSKKETKQNDQVENQMNRNELIIKMQRDLDEVRAALIEATEGKAHADATVEKMKKTEDGKNAEISELTNAIATAQQECNLMRRQRDEATEDKAKTEATLKKMEKAEDVKSAEIRELTHAITTAQQECNHLREQCYTNAQAAAEKMKEDEEFKNAEVRALLRDNTDVQKECDHIRDQRDETQALLNDIIQERDSAREELSTAGIVSAHGTNADDTVIKKYKQKIEEQVIELQALRDEINKHDDVNELNVNKLIAADATHAAGDQLLTQAEQTILQLQRRLTLTEEHRDLAESMLKELQAGVEGISSSHTHAQLAAKVLRLTNLLAAAEAEKAAVDEKNMSLMADVRLLKDHMEGLQDEQREQLEGYNNETDNSVFEPKNTPASSSHNLRTPTSQSHLGLAAGRGVQKIGRPPVFSLCQEDSVFPKQEASSTQQ